MYKCQPLFQFGVHLAFGFGDLAFLCYLKFARGGEEADERLMNPKVFGGKAMAELFDEIKINGMALKNRANNFGDVH